MKIIRPEDINARFEILRNETKQISNELIEKAKELQKSEAKFMENSLAKVKVYTDKALHLANDINTNGIAYNLEYSAKHCELYDQYFRDIKELALDFNNQYQLILELHKTRNDFRTEVTTRKLELYEHLNALLIQILNDYSNNLITNNKENESAIHNSIDNFGSLSFYNNLLEIVRK